MLYKRHRACLIFNRLSREKCPKSLVHRVISMQFGRSGGCHAEHPFRHRARWGDVDGIFSPLRPGGHIPLGLNARWVVCTHACLGRSARFSLWHSLLLLVPSRDSQSNLARYCWHGRVLHRCRVSSDYRYRTGHRDDVELYNAFAAAGGMFCGHGCSHVDTE